MIRQVKEQLSEQLLDDIAKTFNFDARAFKDLEGYESIVLDAGSSILKLNHSQDRTQDELLAELKFINHLAAGGASVAKALPSVKGELVETFPLNEEALLVSQLEKVEGVHPTFENASAELFQTMGRSLGKMHALTKTYNAPLQQKRNDWFEDKHVKNWQLNVPQAAPARGRVSELYNKLMTLDTHEDAYGLIHADFHSDNFLLNNGEITVIDFGDCLYGWFAMDIATAMYYFRRFLKDGHNASEAEQQVFARQFYKQFMQGYLQENSLTDDWLESLSDFLMWRYVDFYLYLHDVKQEADLDEEEQAALEEIERSIEENKLPFELDWVKEARA